MIFSGETPFFLLKKNFFLRIIVLNSLFFRTDIFRCQKSDFEDRKQEAKDIPIFSDEDR